MVSTVAAGTGGRPLGGKVARDHGDTRTVERVRVGVASPLYGHAGAERRGPGRSLRRGRRTDSTHPCVCLRGRRALVSGCLRGQVGLTSWSKMQTAELGDYWGWWGGGPGWQGGGGRLAGTSLPGHGKTREFKGRGNRCQPGADQSRTLGTRGLGTGSVRVCRWQTQRVNTTLSHGTCCVSRSPFVRSHRVILVQASDRESLGMRPCSRREIPIVSKLVVPLTCCACPRPPPPQPCRDPAAGSDPPAAVQSPRTLWAVAPHTPAAQTSPGEGQAATHTLIRLGRCRRPGAAVRTLGLEKPWLRLLCVLCLDLNEVCLFLSLPISELNLQKKSKRLSLLFPAAH